MTRKNNTASRHLNDDNTVLRRLTGAAVLVVGGIAAVVSYWHIYKIAAQLGQPPLAAWLMPLSVDRTVGAAPAALLWAARSGQRSPWTARTMLALGVLATLALGLGPGGHLSLSAHLSWPEPMCRCRRVVESLSGQRFPAARHAARSWSAMLTARPSATCRLMRTTSFAATHGRLFSGTLCMHAEPGSDHARLHICLPGLQLYVLADAPDCGSGQGRPMPEV